MPRLREAKAKQEQPEVQDELPLADGEIERTEGSQLHTNPELFEGEEQEVEDQGFGAKPDKEEKKKPEVVQKTQEDEPNSLQKQLEALKRSEETSRRNAEQYARERDEAIAKARERDGEVQRYQRESLQSQLDTVSTALAAAMSESESAKRDIRTAITNGDIDAQVEAQERLATARASIARLEDGKFELEARVKAPQEKTPEPESDDPLAKLKIPQSAKDWLRKNPEYLQNPRLNAKIQALHYDVLEEGHQFGDSGYFESLETKLGMRKALVAGEEDEEEIEVRPTPRNQQQRSSVVSAPVSRDTPSSFGVQQDGSVRLSRDQREAAKIAGVTEKEYMLQLKKIAAQKANGSFGGQQ